MGVYRRKHLHVDFLGCSMVSVGDTVSGIGDVR